MLKIEKTVFISYRRTNIYTARAVYDNLTRHGYDVFFDYDSINSGDFEQIILNSIAGRAHFVLILTPSALERCTQPGDWLRREIEHAMRYKRNIIPLTFEGFDFKEMTQHLPESLSKPLGGYNGLRVPADYFDEAMEKLRNRFLNIPLEMVIHPTTPQTQQYEEQQQHTAEASPTVSADQLLAEELVEKALASGNRGDRTTAIRLATEAIALQPNFALAYSTRGVNYSERGDHEVGMMDINKALALAPDTPRIVMHRGNVHQNKKDYAAAIHDYTRAIELDPRYAMAYNNRGAVYDDKGEYDAAMRDYNRAIELDPHLALAYNNRGSAYDDKGEYDAAIHDYNRAIELDPHLALAYNNRGNTYYRKGDYDAAIRDYERALQIDPNHAFARDNLEIVRNRKKGR